jgi:hypothetical protein
VFPWSDKLFRFVRQRKGVCALGRFLRAQSVTNYKDTRGWKRVKKLIGSGLAVCLLEGGGMEFAWPSQSLYSGLNVGLP